MRVLLIFNNNHFTRNDLTEKLRENTWEFPLETFWHPGDPSSTFASLLRHSTSACVRVASPLDCVSLCIVSQCPYFTSSSVTDCCWCPPLPPPCNSPFEIDLLLFENRFSLWYWMSVSVSPKDPQIFCYTFPIDESTDEIKSLINS